jgi:hypothetical protein
VTEVSYRAGGTVKVYRTACESEWRPPTNCARRRDRGARGVSARCQRLWVPSAAGLGSRGVGD